MASTMSPTRSFEESPKRAGSSPVVSVRPDHRQVAGREGSPRASPPEVLLVRQRTSNRVAVPTTWALVTMSPGAVVDDARAEAVRRGDLHDRGQHLRRTLT